jgi:DNA-binding NarL/FixJ family response regulator
MGGDLAQGVPIAVRVLIVEPMPLLRLGLQVTMEKEPDLEVVGVVDDLEAAEKAISAAWPDVVLVSRVLTGKGFPDVLLFVEQLQKRVPGTRTILLGQGIDELDARRAIRAGAWGYLPITIAPAALAAAVRAVHAGEIALPRSLIRQLLVGTGSRSAAS